MRDGRDAQACAPGPVTQDGAMLTIPLTLLAALSAVEDADDVAAFAAPQRLMAGTEALGRSQMYPSPVLFDVDGDGALELITGDLFGHLKVHEPVEGEGRTTWSEPKPLKGANGKALKLDNW